jgi:hypothetical protein
MLGISLFFVFISSTSWDCLVTGVDIWFHWDVAKLQGCMGNYVVLLVLLRDESRALAI